MNIKPLSSKQIQHFADQGFLIFDPQIDEDTIENLKRSIYPYYSEQFRENPTSPERIQDAWKFIEEVREIAVSDVVKGALKQLFGRRAKPFQTLNFPVGTTQRPHSDTIHFNASPKGFMCGVWVALEDIDASNGPLVYYPGSHQLREYTMQDFNLKPSYDDYHLYEGQIEKLIQRENLQAQYGLVKKGQAIIWHANLIHGGAAQVDPQRSRHSQVTHYYFSGCRYYTPMESESSKRKRRRPYWVSQSKLRTPLSHPAYNEIAARPGSALPAPGKPPFLRRLEDKIYSLLE